jgi:hypothetical protein
MRAGSLVSGQVEEYIIKSMVSQGKLKTEGQVEKVNLPWWVQLALARGGKLANPLISL